MTFFKPELVIRPRYALDQHPQHGADVSYASEFVYVPLEDAKLSGYSKRAKRPDSPSKKSFKRRSAGFSKRSAETSERLRPRSENNQAFYVFAIEIILS